MKIKPAANCDGREAVEALVSLIRKSEKALRKLDPARWQYQRLHGDLQGLSLAVRILKRGAGGHIDIYSEELKNARRVLGSILLRTRAMRKKMVAGKAPHTLLTRRLQALRVALEALNAKRQEIGPDPRGAGGRGRLPAGREAVRIPPRRLSPQKRTGTEMFLPTHRKRKR